MARYEYRALSAAGDVVTGEVEAVDMGAVLEQLNALALLPMQAVEKRPGAGFQFNFNFGAAKAFPSAELALFIQQLTRLLKASLPLDRALEILTTLLEGKRTRQLVQAVLEKVRDGASLAEAMAAQENAFPRLCISMVRAGEDGGALRPVLARVGEFLVRAEAMRQKVVSALIYPAILCVVALGSIVLILTMVIPQFESMFAEAGDRLPTTTWLVMLASRGLRDNWWELLLGIAVLAAALQWLMRRPGFRLLRDRAVLHLPLVSSLVTRFEVGRFSRSLGVLLTNGVPAARALSLAGATVGNLVFTEAIETLAARFKEGEGLAPSLAQTGCFPVLAIQLIQIGEETGRLEDMLGEIADIYDQEVERVLERLLSLLVPGITVAMGMVVALIMAAVMTAMISINDLAL